MPTRKPDTTKGFHPRIPGTPDTVQPALAALRLDGGLDRSVLSPQLHQVLLGVARLRNAVSSFRLEGERVHVDRARDVLATGRPETPNERGVLQLARAYRDVGTGKLPEFSLAGIERAHERLFKGVLDERLVGHFKDAANVITDVSETIVRFEPTPPERVRRELNSLLSWLGEVAESGLPPVTAALFFAEFEAIHPFSDGNGRVGRYLNIALLHRLGLRNSPLIPLDTRFFRTSDRYYEALASTNSGKEYFLWTRYYTRELEKAYEVALGRGDLRSTLARFSRRSTQSVLLWILSGAGDWFHRGDYPNAPGYSGPAIWKALQELVRAGVLEERGAAKGREYRLKSGFLADVYSRMT